MKKYYDIIKKSIKDKNLVPKAISLLLAIILWLYVSKENISDISIKFPITFSGLDDSYVISGISAKTAVAKISGHKDDIKGIDSRSIKLIVDLSTAEPGDYKKYPIEWHKIDFAGDYNVTINPKDVEILIEKKITRRVKVIPEFKLNAKDGAILGQATIVPEHIKIEGAASIINNIGAIHTENILVDDKSETFSRDVKIIKAHQDNVNYSISRVNITVPIINSKTDVIELPILIKNKKPGFNYLLIFDKVKVQIIKNPDENITQNSLSAYVDCSEIKFDDGDFTSKSKITAIGFVYVAAGTLKYESRILSSTPSTVEIVITKE